MGRRGARGGDGHRLASVSDPPSGHGDRNIGSRCAGCRGCGVSRRPVPDRRASSANGGPRGPGRRALCVFGRRSLPVGAENALAGGDRVHGCLVADSPRQSIMMRSIGLPAFNEAGYIAEMVQRTISAGQMRSDPFEIIVVDNASIDETRALVEEVARREPRVRLIANPENRLYSASCATVTKSARGDRIFILDSDGQHPPEDIWKFDRKLDEGYDIVFGWRTQRHERVARLAMSRFLLGLTRYYVGFDLHDINCGIRAFNRAYADRLEIKHRVNFVNPELFVRAKLGGFRIGEVTVVQEHRKAGVSSHEFGRLWRIFQTVRAYLAALSGELKERRS